jgi:hypothetical protein
MSLAFRSIPAFDEAERGAVEIDPLVVHLEAGKTIECQRGGD